MSHMHCWCGYWPIDMTNLFQQMTSYWPSCSSIGARRHITCLLSSGWLIAGGTSNLCVQEDNWHPGLLSHGPRLVKKIRWPLAHSFPFVTWMKSATRPQGSTWWLPGNAVSIPKAPFGLDFLFWESRILYGFWKFRFWVKSRLCCLDTRF